MVPTRTSVCDAGILPLGERHCELVGNHNSIWLGAVSHERSSKRGNSMNKTAQAFRTISEVSEELDVPKHVLRFWEMKFPQIKPMKRGGGRRYYRPEDLELLSGIRHLLHAEAYTIKGVQKILRERGVDAVKSAPHAGKHDGSAQPSAAGFRSRSGAKGRAASRTVKGEAATSATGTSRGKGAALPAAASKAIEQAIAELKSCQAILRQGETPVANAGAASPEPSQTRRQA